MQKARASRSQRSEQSISTITQVNETELLKSQLEAKEARVQVLELEKRVVLLEKLITEQTAVIKENTALLRKQRLPRRPYLNSTAKAIPAARQGFKCANPDGSCPLFKTSDGTFCESLYEVDHIIPYHLSGLHTGNLHALCALCHARRTRLQIAETNRHESDSEDDGLN